MADPKNKWSQPAAPPSPMFFGKKERELVKQVNDELAERVIGQAVVYYPISLEESNFNTTYGEAVEKVALPPIRVYAYVVVENEQSNEKYGYEYTNKLTVNFHRARLTADQDLYVRVGDYLQYGEKFYEIVKTYNDTRYLFGQVEHKFQISADCVEARPGAFRVEKELTRPTALSASSADTSSPAPRSAPYPPLAATYITVVADPKLPNERVLTAGPGITLDDSGPGGAMTIARSSGHKRKAIINDYSVELTDYYLGIDTTLNTVDLTLPAASTATEGQTYVIKDEGGNAFVNNINVLATDTIDGSTSVTLSSPYASMSLYTDGANWFIY